SHGCAVVPARPLSAARRAAGGPGEVLRRRLRGALRRGIPEDHTPAGDAALIERPRPGQARPPRSAAQLAQPARAWLAALPALVGCRRRPRRSRTVGSAPAPQAA